MIQSASFSALLCVDGEVGGTLSDFCSLDVQVDLITRSEHAQLVDGPAVSGVAACSRGVMSPEP